MSDEIKLRQDEARAVHAQRLLDDELLKEAFAKLEQAYIERWRITHIDDAKGREHLFMAVNMVGKVRDHLVRIVQNGSLARTELNNLAKAAKAA